MVIGALGKYTQQCGDRMTTEVILVGGGGHCKSCIDVIEQTGNYQIAGIVDVPERVNQKVLGYKIVATDDDFPMLVNAFSHFLVTLGQIRSPLKRISLFRSLKALNARFPIIISPHAYVSKHAIIGEGSIIMHHACINAGAEVGSNCIINSKALIEHEAVIEDNCHISTGAIVNGQSTVREGSFVGSNSVIREKVVLERNSIIRLHSRVSNSNLIDFE